MKEFLTVKDLSTIHEIPLTKRTAVAAELNSMLNTKIADWDEKQRTDFINVRQVGGTNAQQPAEYREQNRVDRPN